MQDLVITQRLTIPSGELSIQFARSGGSGGQNVNKVSSKVDLRWDLASSASVTDEEIAADLRTLKSKSSLALFSAMADLESRTQLKM